MFFILLFKNQKEANQLSEITMTMMTSIFSLLYVLMMSRTAFRVNPQSIVGQFG